ncbi:chemotaxis protein CheA [Lachnospiraceae bacterium ZAX-1]
MDVSQYLEIFIDETNGHLQDLSDCIMTLESEPENMDTINEIFRAAHSLKGMAGTMGFKRMQHLTHVMENIFQEVREDNMKVTSELVDVLFQCLDALDGYLESVKSSSDEGTDDNEPIIQKLDSILKVGTGKQGDAKEAKPEAQANVPATAEEEQGFGNYFDIELSDKEKEELKEAEEKGQNIYALTVVVEDDCLLRAARSILVFKSIEEFGDIVVYSPSMQDIEDENFDSEFYLFVAAEESLEKIIEASSSVSEIAEVRGQQITTAAIAEAYQKKVDEQVAKEEAEAKAAAQQPASIVKKEVPKQPVAVKQAAPAKPTAAKPVANRTVRVDIEKLDALMNQVSELIIAKNSLVSISATGGGNFQNQLFHEQIEYLERITTSLHESVMKVRMVPIESVVNKFPRLIRDLAKKLDKKMQLIMSGEDTELDRTVVDQIGDPLQHLLRNSADHGLESTEVRVERGKPETGSIYLNAFQEGNNVVIEVSDDGNGINTETVKAKAIERGIVSAEQAEFLSQKEIIDFLFMPSFSMAKEITDVSGRGVGLDVVKSNIEALGGDVEVNSVLGEGSKFTVRLPLTLAIIQALMVEIREEKYAIALGSIQTIEDISVEEIKYVQAKEVINIRGTVIPLIRVDALLDIEPKDEEEKSLTVVIVRKGAESAGLVVDNLMGQQEIVIKSLGKYIENNRIISGATILGDGEVALILDVNTLM